MLKLQARRLFPRTRTSGLLCAALLCLSALPSVAQPAQSGQSARFEVPGEPGGGGGSVPPVISIVEPDGSGDTATSTFTISWTDSFDGGDASIALYYDTNASGQNGTLIVNGLSENSSVDHYVWDVSALAPGSYYVYGVISYPGYTASTQYSSGPVTVPQPALVNDADFASQSVPAVMAAGAQVPVTVSMKNVGTTTWTEGAGYKLGSQNPHDNTQWGLARVLMDSGESIAPNETKTFSFTVTAPATPGTYNFQWRILETGVEWFGERSQTVAVEVQDVSEPLPEAFSFAPIQHAEGGREYVSNHVLMQGLGGSTTATLSGDASARIIVDGQEQGTSATVYDGDAVALRADAPASGTKTLTLTAGSQSADWELTAGSKDPLPTLSGDLAGETPGEFAVSETGTATYSIPIEVAPGTAGMAPQLSLVYSSQAGNSLVGVGWSLAGLSTITRCPATEAQDGFVDGVDFDADDRFCLDGERLMAIDGTYGADGTEYRTEQDTFRKIVSYGATGSGPTKFLVRTKDGLTLHYGYTSDSRIEAQGKASVLVWALCRVTDTASNRMDVTYQENSTLGSFHPVAIDYTRNDAAGLSPYASVELLYEGRPDKVKNFLAGSLLKTTQRLKTIVAMDGASIYREYRLGYQVSPLSSGRSLLTSVQECGSDGSCLAPTELEWSSAAFSGPSRTNWSASSSWGGGGFTWADDFNGDGLTDLASAKGGSVYMELSTGGGFLHQTWNVHNAWGGGEYTRVGDFNGDGLPDVASPNQGNVYMKISTGSGFQSDTWTVHNAWGGAGHTHLGDFDGDGRTDFASADGSSVFMKISKGDRFESETWGVDNAWGGSSHARAGDFNGDGLTDIASPDQGNVYMKLSTGSGFVSDVWTVTKPWGGGGFTWAADFNGDGLTDLATADQGNLYVNLSTGDGFLSARWGDDHLWGDESYTWPADFNGDGLTDLVSADGGSLYVKLSTGTDFQKPTFFGSNQWGAGSHTRVGDFDGDGLADIASADGNIVHMRLGAGPPAPDKVTGITTGHGHETEITYGPLTDPQLYTKGNAGAWPEIDFISSAQVVASHASSNGIGGMKTTSYRYGDAKMNLHGRGFRGFGEVTVTDGETGIESTTFYDRHYQCVSSKVRRLETRHPSGWLLSEVDNDFLIQDHGHGVHFSHVSESVAVRYELDGSYVSTTTSDFTYDAFGNVLTHSVNYGGGHTDSTVNTYSNDTGSWHLGRLTRREITRKVPGRTQLKTISAHHYDGATGLLNRSIVQPGNATLEKETTYQRDAFGNVVTTTTDGPGVAPRSHSVTYDGEGRYAILSTNALGHEETRTYSLGNLASSTGPNGLTTTWTYDGFGRRTEEARADGTKSRTTYLLCTSGWCPSGAVYRTVTDTSGAPRQYRYFDLLHRDVRTRLARPSGYEHRITKYTARGEVDRVSEPYLSGESARWTIFTYDLLGRETSRKQPGNRITSTARSGPVTTITNPLGQTSQRTVDLRGRLVTSTDDLGASVSYEYDSLGNLVEITGPAGDVTTMTYDIRSHRKSIDDPDAGLTTFQVNALGEIISETDAGGQTVTLAYDLLGRLVSRTEAEGTSLWEYDTAENGVGALARVSKAGGGYERELHYDSLSRPRETVYRFANDFFSLYRTYDRYGRTEALRYPSGLAVESLYDSVGHLATLRRLGDGPIYWQGGSRNARGQWEQFTLGNGLTTQRTYDPDTGLVSTIQTGAVQDLSFTFDDLGNLTQRRDLGRGLTENFAYDDLNRLTSAQVVGRSAVTASYDSRGNIASRSDVGTYSYGAGSAGPHAVTSISGPKANAYTYDPRGNRISSSTGTVQYTSFNLPHTIQDGSSEVLFFYGPERERFEQQVREGGATTKTKLYVGGVFERETESGVTRDVHYVRGPEGPIAIATAERTPAGTYTSQETRYLHHDHLGSVQAVTDAAGSLVEALSYDAWGQRRNGETWAPASSVTSGLDRGFTGHEMLDSVDLIHMNGRVYDPVIGRFLSPDPFVQTPEHTQGLNPYTYVLNNPLSFTDPSGHFLQVLVPLIAGVLSGQGTAALVAGVLKGSLGLKGASLAVASTIGSAAGFGFGASFTGALMGGADLGEALQAGVIGAVTSGLTAGALAGIDAVLPDWLSQTANALDQGGSGQALSNARRLRSQLVRNVARGTVRGGVAELRGQDFEKAFWHSFASDALRLGRDFVVDRSLRGDAYSCTKGAGNCELGENWKENGWKRITTEERAKLYRSASSRLVPPTEGPSIKFVSSTVTGAEFPFGSCGGGCNTFGTGLTTGQEEIGSFPSLKGWNYEGSWVSTVASRAGPFLHSTSVFHDSLAFLGRQNLSSGAARVFGLASMPVAFATEAAILSPDL